MGVFGLPDSKKGEIMGVVQEMEQQYTECTNELLDNFQKAYKLWCAKQHDYGDSNIRLGLNLSSSSSESSQNNRLAQLGIIIRMNDKISRLINLYKKDMIDASAVEESVEDTCLDVMNYANMLMVLKSGKWGK